MLDNILQTIGNTPIVRINKLNPNKDVNIYAKLEGFNPTGSGKNFLNTLLTQQKLDLDRSLRQLHQNHQ